MGVIFRGQLPWGNHSGIIVWGANFRGVILLGVFQGSQQFCILLFLEFSLNFLCFQVLLPWVHMKKGYIFLWLLVGVLTKKMLSNELFWTRIFNKRKTKFILSTKCYMSNMNKLWTKHNYSINKLKRPVNIFPEISLTAFIFQEISLSFPGFPWFFNFSWFFPHFPGFPWFFNFSWFFPDFPGFPWVL